VRGFPAECEEVRKKRGVDAVRDFLLRYMIQPLVELYGGCMVVLKVS
jgi:hypothetical protein